MSLKKYQPYLHLSTHKPYGLMVFNGVLSANCAVVLILLLSNRPYYLAAMLVLLALCAVYGHIALSHSASTLEIFDLDGLRYLDRPYQIVSVQCFFGSYMIITGRLDSIERGKIKKWLIGRDMLDPPTWSHLVRHFRLLNWI